MNFKNNIIKFEIGVPLNWI